jgi:hypothetical protein
LYSKQANKATTTTDKNYALIMKAKLYDAAPTRLKARDSELMELSETVCAVAGQLLYWLMYRDTKGTSILHTTSNSQS